MKTSLFACVTICLLTVFQLSVAHAGQLYNVPSASCTPSSAAIQNDSYMVSGVGTVKHKSSNIDVVTFYCAIPKLPAAPTRMHSMYFSSFNATTTYVVASYVKMNRGTGVVTTIHNASSQLGPTGAVSYVNESLIDAYDFDNFIYYIVIELHRNTSANYITSYSVGLEN